MFFSYTFFWGVFLTFLFFRKKLIYLLGLEILMIFMIGMFFFSFLKNLGSSSFFNSLIFLIFMVLDSVMGISLLISSSRVSSFMETYLNFY